MSISPGRNGNRASARWLLRIGVLCIFLMMAVVTPLSALNLTSNVPVPILSCEAIGASCNNAPPLYGGPTPPEWGAAAQLQCQRFSAAHYMHGTCGSGRVCSPPASCALVQPIVPDGSEGGNVATGPIQADGPNHTQGVRRR